MVNTKSSNKTELVFNFNTFVKLNQKLVFVCSHKNNVQKQVLGS